jgi:hypothetical protein
MLQTRDRQDCKKMEEKEKENKRDEFLGLHVSKDLKEELTQEASNRNMSLSAYVAEKLRNRKSQKELLEKIENYLTSTLPIAEEQEEIIELLSEIRAVLI